MSIHSDFIKYPTGKIPTGAFCNCCGRYNSRYTTASVILIHDGKIVLVKRAEEPDKDKWDIPGGYLLWNETLEESARREMLEETGLQVGSLELFMVRSDPLWDPLGKQNIDHFYITTEYTGDTFQGDHEVIEVKWFSLNALPEEIAFDQRWIVEKAAASLRRGN